MHTAFELWKHQLKPSLSTDFMCELNFYATHMLCETPGTSRQKIEVDVYITETPHVPPRWWEVDELLVNFLQVLSVKMSDQNPFLAAAFVLWRLNWIHPFAQGNGRTSRALCYFVICQKFDIWLPGAPILPELIKANRPEYCELLKNADLTEKNGILDLLPIANFLERLLFSQLSTVKAV